jgi:3-oxoacyl-[acyl-carrier protein] reductase
MAGVEGRVALVTGASQGIGRACALLLASSGAKVALAARNEEKLAATKAQIEAAGGQAETFKLDVANEDEVKATVKAVVAKFGRLDILVNNAGITRDQLLLRMKRADWDAVLATNLTGAYLCAQQAVGAMLKQRYGRIINMTSIFGEIGQAGQANYSAAKAGLIGLTKAIAREVGSRSITCNAVAPGWIDTDMTKDLPQEMKDQVLKMVPLGRIGTDMDIAHAVRFLASEEAGYITGHVLDVNGGMHMG